MHISVVTISHQILLLEALQVAVVGTEFQIMSSPFKERQALDEFTVTPPRCLILDGSCPKHSPLVMVDWAKRMLPDTLISDPFVPSRANPCSRLASPGSLIRVAQVKMLFWCCSKSNGRKAT